MDPNATLRAIRELIYSDELPKDENVGQLVYLVEALDDWLNAGGFLPEAWQK